MPQIIPIVLWGWVPFTIWLFWRCSGRSAALVGLLGGWLLLPKARFSDDVAQAEFPYWIMPACLPSSSSATKATIVGLACLLGLLLFDWRRIGRLRPIGADVVVLGWCVWPMIAALANDLPVAEAVASAAYQTLAWGVPYLLGRVYFAVEEGMNTLARAIVACGLLCVPLGLAEVVSGPFCYVSLYGFQPFREIGAVRYLGYRPILLFEDGNQFGIFMATSALVAAWLWISGQMERLGRLPGWLVVATLVGMSLSAQSVGAIILLGVGLAGLLTLRRCNLVWPIIAAMLLVTGLLAVRAANLVDARSLAERSGLGRTLIALSVRLDRKSFGWRLRVEERHARLAMERPWSGWGRWDWWRRQGSEERPWGLFSLVFGMYGAVGLVLLAGILAAPIVHFLRLGPPRLWSDPSRAAAAAMAAALGINALDAILNGPFLVVLMVATGGLAGYRLMAFSPPSEPIGMPPDLFWARVGPAGFEGKVIPRRRGSQ
jgi:hypothetical protein